MHFRTVRTTHKAKVTQYGQIVQSYRRESDGMPATRVLNSLGVVTDREAENYKMALIANRLGSRVQIVDAEFLARLTPTVAWTRDLADICACLQAWEDSGMKRLLQDIFVGHGDDVQPADVVAALVTQRCVAPASKLAATRWFPNTALPELLAISPALFHNTRIHSVLSRLEACDADLQNSLSTMLLHADHQPRTAFFIDCTDTWFTANGPSIAQRGKTKEEFYRRKIGIVLLCRDDGMPLRFKVVQGNTDDGVAMLAMLDSLRAEPWMGTAPLVADRALGNTADFIKLIAEDIPFITSLVAQERAAYGATVACPALMDLDHNVFSLSCLAALRSRCMIRSTSAPRAFGDLVARRANRPACSVVLGRWAIFGSGEARNSGLAADVLSDYAQSATLEVCGAQAAFGPDADFGSLRQRRRRRQHWRDGAGRWRRLHG